MNSNGGTKVWVSIIVGIVIAFSGLTFGIIKGEQARTSQDVRTQIVEMRQKLTVVDARLYALEARYEVIITKLDAIKEQLTELKSK